MAIVLDYDTEMEIIPGNVVNYGHSTNNTILALKEAEQNVTSLIYSFLCYALNEILDLLFDISFLDTDIPPVSYDSAFSQKQRKD